MKTLFINLFLGLVLLSIVSTGNARGKPFCANGQSNYPMVIGYLGADSSWKLKNGDQVKLAEQLSHVSVINYSFIRLAKDTNGHTILAPTAQDIENIQLLRQIKPDLPIMIAVGGWGEREGFKPFLENEYQRTIFVKSVQELLAQYRLDGIDVDWENELLASEQEISGVAALLKLLHEQIGKSGYCVTNAVPGTKAYWTQYPDASLWQAYVNWTTVMAYDNYGTFGPRTEHAAALYEPHRINEEGYPYPNTSGNKAVQHYYKQGLAANKIILGIPFYCHSYFINNNTIVAQADAPGLHVPVLDPNISSQVSYMDAYTAYGDKLYTYTLNPGNSAFHAVSFYGLIPIEHTEISRFMSCEGPQSVLDKVAYVKGNNPMSKGSQKIIKLGGVSFWSLQQDLPFPHPQSLLHAINEGFNQ
ncbi:glycoside hydrolase family 18 protein [Legionella maioricensis]|uniref:chitinase n=1 Tax=Legionella maioricensis TaxID=2896528 RepID=A0A9X2IBR3_9GAMM|nr:glycoside hydrolase family 18 protein [Legionella maioricensis]MCL9683647.1 glycoside hydrolase family 18 protein [Legionella maioricensis]MCL9687669.1 glycoside hydrolase family 18 protein [Legionella maioricensis]